MGYQRLQLRSKQQQPSVVKVVEWLDPDPVPEEEKLLAFHVPQRKSEHASEAGNAFGPPLSISIQNNFRIRVTGELVPIPDQFLFNLPVVVNLAVESNHHRVIGVRHRLPASW